MSANPLKDLYERPSRCAGPQNQITFGKLFERF